MGEIRIDAKRLRTIAFYILIGGWYLVVIFLAVWLNKVLKLPNLFSFPPRVFGFILTAVGVSLIAWCCWLQFKVGEGTTVPSEPTKKLVTWGPYGVVRNPMYYGQFLVFAGLGFLLDLGAMFLILPAVILTMHGSVIFYEEPDMKKRFGQEWIDYTKSVPRWVPKPSWTHDR
ncbi:MAG: methyltransferase family protein [Candidatus Hodarchaeota archaeon]